METEYDFTEVEYDLSQGKRDATDPVGAGKTRITIRIDDDVLEWFREQVHQAGGGNSQTLMNEALRSHIQQQHEPPESTLRRVLREEEINQLIFNRTNELFSDLKENLEFEDHEIIFENLIKFGKSNLLRTISKTSWKMILVCMGLLVSLLIVLSKFDVKSESDLTRLSASILISFILVSLLFILIFWIVTSTIDIIRQLKTTEELLDVLSCSEEFRKDQSVIEDFIQKLQLSQESEREFILVKIDFLILGFWESNLKYLILKEEKFKESSNAFMPILVYIVAAIFIQITGLSDFLEVKDFFGIQPLAALLSISYIPIVYFFSNRLIIKYGKIASIIEKRKILAN
jgi:uncharacterized protein (DUF4415 family)